MSEYAMLIDYEYCSGCKTCEIACNQEYNREAGKLGGVEVQEFIHFLQSGRLYITNIPHFTKACVFCAGRVKKGLTPACVQHCMANVLVFDTLENLKDKIPENRKALLWTKG
jgi:Fe-S-cluster-containing dehydrogenase component